MYLVRESINYSYSELLNCLFFIQGFKTIPMNMNGPLWTLGDEFFLYILASFFALFFLNKKKYSLLIIFSLLFVVFKTEHIYDAIYFYKIWFLGAFFAWYERQNTFNVNRKVVKTIWLFSLVSLIVVMIKKFHSIPAVNYHLVNAFIIIQLLSIIFTISTFYILNLDIRNKIIKIFEFITPKKDFTYTLYVIHLPILLFVFSLTHKWLAEKSLLTSILFVIILIPLIIFIAKKLAFYLENTHYFKKLVGIK